MHLPQKPVAFALLGDTPNPWAWTRLRPEPAETEEICMAILDLLKKKNKADQESVPVIEQPAAAQTVADAEKKKQRRTPQDRSKLTRNKVVQIRMTEEEVAKLKSAAADAGMSLADFVMAGVEQKRVVRVDGAMRVMANLGLCGNNLNQAVRLGHMAKRQGQTIDMVGIEKAVADLEKAILGFTAFLKKWDVELAEKTRKDVTKNANR